MVTAIKRIILLFLLLLRVSVSERQSNPVLPAYNSESFGVENSSGSDTLVSSSTVSSLPSGSFCDSNILSYADINNDGWLDEYEYSLVLVQIAPSACDIVTYEKQQDPNVAGVLQQVWDIMTCYCKRFEPEGSDADNGTDTDEEDDLCCIESNRQLAIPGNSNSNNYPKEEYLGMICDMLERTIKLMCSTPTTSQPNNNTFPLSSSNGHPPLSNTTLWSTLIAVGANLLFLALILIIFSCYLHRSYNSSRKHQPNWSTRTSSEDVDDTSDRIAKTNTGPGQLLDSSSRNHVLESLAAKLVESNNPGSSKNIPIENIDIQYSEKYTDHKYIHNANNHYGKENHNNVSVAASYAAPLPPPSIPTSHVAPPPPPPPPPPQTSKAIFPPPPPLPPPPPPKLCLPNHISTVQQRLEQTQPKQLAIHDRNKTDINYCNNHTNANNANVGNTNTNTIDNHIQNDDHYNNESTSNSESRFDWNQYANKCAMPPATAEETTPKNKEGITINGNTNNDVYSKNSDKTGQGEEDENIRIERKIQPKRQNSGNDESNSTKKTSVNKEQRKNREGDKKCNSNDNDNGEKDVVEPVESERTGVIKDKDNTTNSKKKRDSISKGRSNSTSGKSSRKKKKEPKEVVIATNVESEKNTQKQKSTSDDNKVKKQETKDKGDDDDDEEEKKKPKKIPVQNIVDAVFVVANKSAKKDDDDINGDSKLTKNIEGYYYDEEFGGDFKHLIVNRFDDDLISALSR